MWVVYAIFSAVFAAATSILAKMGIGEVNSNLATAIRTVIVLIMAWIVVYITGTQGDVKNITQKSMIFIVLSGVATGLSWLCYFRAIQIGEVSKVVPIDKFSIVLTIILSFIILKEPITVKVLIGGILITVGTFVMIL